MRRPLLELIYCVLLLVALDVLPVGFKALAVLFSAVFIATVWFDVRNRILSLVSILIAVFILNLALPKFMAKTYYRPHEIFKKEQMKGFKRYVPNQEVTIQETHGDLIAVGFSHPEVESIRETRREHFFSDDNGYPNKGKTHGRFTAILAGDSFIAGNGNDAADTVAAQLRSRGIDVYNLGHNGDIGEYLASLRYAKNSLGIDGPGYIFAYEGNDFAGVNYCVSAESPVGGIRDLHRSMKELHISRFLTALYGHLARTAQPPAIEIASVGNKNQGFLLESIANASVKTYDGKCLSKLLQEYRDVVSAIFFIPVKERVYEYDGVKGESIYAKALASAAETLHVPFVDLTEPLINRAKELLPRGKYVFWRDDTHWNREGAAVAAREVERLLTKHAR
jgi:hypothetical protein